MIKLETNMKIQIESGLKSLERKQSVQLKDTNDKGLGSLEQKIKDLQRQVTVNYSSSQSDIKGNLKLDKRIQDLEA